MALQLSPTAVFPVPGFIIVLFIHVDPTFPIRIESRITTTLTTGDAEPMEDGCFWDQEEGEEQGDSQSSVTVLNSKGWRWGGTTSDFEGRELIPVGRRDIFVGLSCIS